MRKNDSLTVVILCGVALILGFWACDSEAQIRRAQCGVQPPDGITPPPFPAQLDKAVQCAAVTEPQPDPVKWDRRAFWITRALDSGTTWYGLQDGASEANPALSGLGGPAEIVAAQFLVSYLVDEYAQHLVANERYREARIIYRVGAVVNGLTAGWNLAQMGRR